MGRARQVVPLVKLQAPPPAPPQPNDIVRPKRVAGARNRRARKERMRRESAPPTANRTEEPQPVREERQPPIPIKTSTTPKPAVSPLPKPTVSIEKNKNIRLDEYKPVHPKKLEKLTQSKKETPPPTSATRQSQSPRKNGRNLRWFESSAADAVTDPSPSSPKPPSLGTGYHYLPTSNELYSSVAVGQPPATDQRVTPIRVDITPRSLAGRRQGKPLYPWLPADRGKVSTPLKDLSVACKERVTRSEPR